MNTDHRLGSFAAISETFPVAIRDIAQAQWRRTTAAPPSAQEMAVLLSRFTQWISHGQSFVVRRGSAIEQFFITNIARGIISGVVVGCAPPLAGLRRSSPTSLLAPIRVVPSLATLMVDIVLRAWLSYRHRAGEFFPMTTNDNQ